MTSHVVIGIGNHYRRDDAVGIAILDHIRPQLPDTVDLVVLDGESTDVIEAWTGAHTAWVVDAVAADTPPGTIHRLELPADAVPAQPRTSTHGMGISEAVALATALDRLPQRLIVYGISGSDFDLGEGMTAAVAGAVQPAADRILAEVRASMATSPA